MSMFRRNRKREDFSAEIESHIAMEADRLRQEGFSAEDAARTARLKFGNVGMAEERFYESRRIAWLDDFRKDVSYAIRVLRHSPAFALTVILTLALGIGAATAIFSVTDAALIRPLPFPQSHRLVSVYERWQGSLDDLAPADYLDYRRQAKSFDDLAGYRSESFNLSGQNRPERLLGAVVTPNFFSVFGVPAQLGRTLNSVDDAPGHTRTVVLSYSLWKRRYAGSSEALGQTVLLDGEPRVIVGVMPPYFMFPGAELWAAARYQVPEHPLRPFIDTSTSRESHYFDIIGRLKPGVSISTAQAEADVISREIKQRYKTAEEGDGPAIIALRDDLLGGSTRPAIFVLLSAVALLFLIACANVANMVLARSAVRQKEIAVRASLGAGRLRLVRQLLVENALLSLCGAAAGLVGARYALRFLNALIPADVLPPGGLHIDVRLLMFAVAMAVLSTVLFGILPALHAASFDLNDALKEGGRTSAGGVGTNQSRNILVAAQIGLAAVLLIGAGLLIRSFDRLLSAPQGFTPDHLLTLQLSLPIAQYPKPADRNRFATQLLEEIRALPGVESATLTSRMPLNPGGSQRGVEIKGRSAPPGEDLSPDYLVISPDYFRTLRIRLLRGRVFTDRDAVDTPGAFIINAAMARHFWPGRNPIGQYMRISGRSWLPVVGVVADVAQQHLDRAPRPAVYVPYAQDTWPSLAVLLRTGNDPKRIVSAAIGAVHQIDKDEPVYNVRTMRDVIACSVQARKFRTILLSVFAFLALSLATVGTYGVIAYSVAQRSREIGIRITLGAAPNRLRLSIAGEALRLAIYGGLGGLIASLWLTHFLSGILYGVRPTDALTFAATFLFLLAAALVASYLPAKRATSANPATVLRS